VATRSAWAGPTRRDQHDIGETGPDQTIRPTERLVGAAARFLSDLQELLA
jgi:hypothetical protein